MKKALLIALGIASFSLFGGTSKANAQAVYAGNYNMLGGYTTGAAFKGLYYKGYVTATSRGAVAYSAYFPYSYYPTYGGTSYGTGTINASGRFSITTRGVYGLVQLLLNKYGYGYFYDSAGSGYFVLSKF